MAEPAVSEELTEASHRPRAWRRLGLILASLVLVGLAGTGIARHIRDNFHQVVRHRVYRSGQLTPTALESRVAIHRIQAVVNLRGPNPREEWYRQERATATRLGIEHYDLMLLSDIPPSSGELRELVRIFDVCKKPVLLHCESGSDRTGLAATIYLLLEEDCSIERAQQQLSLRFGHLPWGKGMRRFPQFLDLYRVWLQSEGLTHSGMNFRHWACGVYQRPLWLGAPDYPKYPP